MKARLPIKKLFGTSFIRNNYATILYIMVLIFDREECNFQSTQIPTVENWQYYFMINTFVYTETVKGQNHLHFIYEDFAVQDHLIQTRFDNI